MKCWRWCLMAWLAAATQIAQAAYTCSVSVTSVTAFYDALAIAANDSIGQYTINCSRASGDSASMAYTLTANNGLDPIGVNNRASRGAAPNPTMRYDVFKDSGYSTKWGLTGGSVISGTLAFGTATSATLTAATYARAPAAQTVQTNSTYVDSIAVTLTYGPANSTATAAMAISISTVPVVVISVPPGDVAFTYSSFAGAQAASTSYVVRGTSGLAYTMALDSSSGSVLGLTYTLWLSAAGGTANGALQTYTINGSMAAGQSGTCASGSCAGSRPHTLTITY